MTPAGPPGRPRVGWHAYRPQPGAELPGWPVEVALTVERPALAAAPGAVAVAPAAARPALAAAAGSLAVTPEAAAAMPGAGDRAQALLLLRRGPARLPFPLHALADAAREVEAVAGVRPVVELALVAAPALPGLMPVTPAVVLAHLAAASARGLAPPARRRQPAAGPQGTWRPSAGSVLVCDGPGGRSAQAVIVLHGVGDAHAVAPPPGGALVLRAWRARRAWGLACGLVLGSAEAIGLGREAGRRAATARAAGWQAAVATGDAAVALARAGDPRQAAPRAAARVASDREVAALVRALLSPAVPGPAPTRLRGSRAATR
jgi:hypothetical protein